MKENNKETVYAFIDSQNINIGISSRKWKLDWGKFRLFLRNKYNVKKAFLFIGFVESNSDLYKHLQEVGFILVFKNVLAITSDGETTYKGNVDAELVLHTMLQAPNYDKAIIATGDGDFFCLIEYLEKNDKLLKIVAPNDRYSSLLRKYSKYIVDISKLKNKLKYVNRRKKSLKKENSVSK